MLTPGAARLTGALAIAAAAMAGSAVSGIEGRQTYRLGVSTAEVVLVDFLATDSTGQPVLDLKPAEIVLKIGGRVRPVASLQLVDFTEASGTSLTASGETLPPAFGSNVLGAARSVVILIDDDSIRPGRERATLAAANDLLDRLPPAARVVIATPHGGWKTKLTTDRAEARRVLSEISGRAFAADDVECRTRVTLDALASTLATFGAEAPTIFVISGGLAGPRQDMTSGSSTLARATVQTPVRLCELRMEDFLKFRDLAAATRAHLYVIQPDDVLVATNMGQLSATTIDVNAGLTNLAALTGGRVVHLTPSSGNPLIAAERESSAYYLAGFERTVAETSGSTHRVDVQVTRPRVKVVRRTEIRIEHSGAAPTGPESTTPGAMLRDPRIRRGLPLRTAGYVSRNANPATPVRVVVFAEQIGSAAGLSAAAAGLFDPQGRLVSEWTSAPGTSLGPGPIVAALSAAPGTYRVRVAALDSAGRTGTADYFVDATLAPAGPLKLSALMFAVSQNGSLRPALEFSSEPAAIASLEIYGEREGKPIVATLEIAETMNGPALRTVPVQVGPTREADSVVLTASIPLGELAPGDYVVRVTVNLQDRPQGRVVRTLRKR